MNSTDPETSPLSGNQEYHFNVNKDAKSGSDGDSRVILAKHHLDEAVKLEKESQEARSQWKQIVENRDVHGALIGPSGKDINYDILLLGLEAEIKHELAMDNLGMGTHAIEDMQSHKDEFVQEIEDQRCPITYTGGNTIYWHPFWSDADNPGDPERPNNRYIKARKDTKEYMNNFRQRTGMEIVDDNNDDEDAKKGKRPGIN